MATSPKKKPKLEDIPFVTQTKKNLKEWIDKNAMNPEDFKVSNYEVVGKTDRLCFINFRAIRENGFSEHMKNFTYLNIKSVESFMNSVIMKEARMVFLTVLKMGLSTVQ